VPDELEYVDLSRDALYVCHINNFILFENFDGHWLSGWLMSGQLDFTEGALTQCPSEAIITYLLLVLLRLFWGVRHQFESKIK
jgi:hypothetical protein